MTNRVLLGDGRKTLAFTTLPGVLQVARRLAHEFSCGSSIFKERSTLHVASASASIVLSVVEVPPVGRIFRIPLWCFRICLGRYVCYVCRVLFVFPVAPGALFSQNDHPTVPQQLQAVGEG